MAVAMVAMLAFGGTYAYFTATAAGASQTFHTGKVVLTDNDFTLTTKTVVPGDYILGAEDNDTATAVFTNGSDVATWMFVEISIELAEGSTLPTTATALSDLLVVTGTSLTPYTITDAEAKKTTIVYQAEGTANGNEAISITNIQVNTEIESDSKSAAELGAYQGLTFTLTIKGRSIQKAHVASADLAYAELFGE